MNFLERKHINEMNIDISLFKPVDFSGSFTGFLFLKERINDMIRLYFNIPLEETYPGEWSYYIDVPYKSKLEVVNAPLQTFWKMSFTQKHKKLNVKAVKISIEEE